MSNIKFRNLKVEPYEANENLPGLSGEGEMVDVSRFSPIQHVVTFEIRESEDAEWRKVKGLA